MKKSDVDIRIVESKKDMEAALEIRRQVFVTGQNVALERERDGHDEEAEHALILYGSKPVGTARIQYSGNGMKLERIAVLEEFRGRGFGRELMKFLIAYGKKKDAGRIYMHAQYYLLDYYKDLGFEPEGDIFYDAGMKHILMAINIKSS